MMDAAAEARFYQEPYVGWCFELGEAITDQEIGYDSELSYPGMLYDDGTRLLLKIPIARRDQLGEIARKFAMEGESYADDEGRERFTYELPSELLFESFEETATLLECRKIRRRFKLIGPAEGQVEIGLAISRASSKRYETPHRVRTYIPGMSEWTGLTPIRIDHELENDGRVKEITIKAGEVRSVKLMDGLELKETWSGGRNNSDDVATLRGDIFLESIVDGATHYQEHLSKHYLFRDLVDIAYWQPTGFRKLEFAVDYLEEKPEAETIAGFELPTASTVSKTNWCEVKSYKFRYQAAPHTATPLFYFQHIDGDTLTKWEAVYSRYKRAIDPLLKLLDLSDAPIESQFMQSCVGLEGIGAQLRQDSNTKKKPKKNKEPLKITLDRIISDLGFSFSDDWAEQTANLYNSIKHYDRNVTTSPSDVADALLENELVFRAWAALKIGITKKVILHQIESTNTAQSLQRRGRFKIHYRATSLILVRYFPSGDNHLEKFLHLKLLLRAGDSLCHTN